MAQTDLKYTYIAKGRYWRFRRDGDDIALPARDDPKFLTRYEELMALYDARAAATDDRQSWRWLIKRYRASAEFNALADRTQDDYSDTLDLLDAEIGAEPFRLTTRAMLKAVRDDYASTPRKAHKIKQMTSRLYSWADEEELVPEGFNPAAGIKRLKARVKPITPWSEEEIVMVLAVVPAHVRTPLMLALYTGQRREDIVSMSWQDYQGAFIRVRQSKTGEPLDIACHRTLRGYLDSIKTDFGGPICRNAEGKPFTANALSQALRRVVESIDAMPNDRSMHGLRYAAAGRLEEAGVTIAQASAVLGHRTYQMAIKYLSQRRASQEAVSKQERGARVRSSRTTLRGRG